MGLVEREMRETEAVREWGAPGRNGEEDVGGVQSVGSAAMRGSVHSETRTFSPRFRV